VALFFIILQNIAVYWEKPSTRKLIVAAIAALVEGFVFPFMALVYGVTLAIAWLLQRRWQDAAWITAGAAALVVLIPLPIAAHYWLAMQQHPIWISFLNQNLTLSPPPRQYVLGYGIVGILALPGGWWAWHSGDQRGRLAVIVVAVSLALAYLPLNFQRRMVSGAHVPMCALAAAGLHGWLMPLWKRWRSASQAKLAYREGLTRAGIVGFSGVSSLYVLLGILISVLAYFPGLYISTDVASGVEWLAEETPSNAAVLSSFDTGRVIPPYAGRHVFWGHSIETPFLSQKQDEASQFFSAATSDADRRAMIERYGITHLFYGPDEQSLGDFDPKAAPYLKPVFKHNNVTIYRLTESPPN
jgi:hypothetical protein